MGTTYYWIGGQGGTADPDDASVVANWATLQGETPVVAASLPAAGDSIVVAVPAPLGGTGTLDDSGLNFTSNAVTLSGDGPVLQLAGLTIDAASVITPDATAATATIDLTGPVTNAGGILQGTAGDTLTVALAGALLNTGTIAATAGTILVQDAGGGLLQNEGTIAALGGTVTIAPSLTGVGLLEIDGGTLELDGSASAAGTVAFLGSTGALAIGAAGSFSGGIVGFAPGGAIDLKGLDPDSLQPIIVNGDLVTLTDGSNSATLDFAGDDFTAADFVTGGEGGGGTTLSLAATAEAVYSAGTSTDWAGAAWSGGVPGAAEAALITAQTATPFTVTIDAVTAAGGLTMLAAAATLAVGSTLTLADGLIVGAGAVSLGSGGSLDVAGAVVLAASAMLTVAAGAVTAAEITTPGTFANGTEEPGGTLVMTGGAIDALDGLALGSVALLGAASLVDGAALSAVTLDVTGGASLTADGLFLGTASIGGAAVADSGDASVSLLSVTADGSIGVAGSLSVTGLAVQTGGSVTVTTLIVANLTLDTGEVGAAGDATISGNGSATLTDGAVLDVGGNLAVGAGIGSFVLAPGSLTAGGTLIVDATMSLDANDTLALSGASSATIATLADSGALSLDTAASLVVGSGSGAAGTLQVVSGGTAALGTLSTPGAVDVDGASALVVGIGAAETGAAVIAAGATATIGSLTAPTLDLEGTATIGEAASVGSAVLNAASIFGAGTLVTPGLTIDTATAFASNVALLTNGETLTLAHARDFSGTVLVPLADGTGSATFDLRDVALASAEAVFNTSQGIGSLGTLAPFSVVAPFENGALLDETWSIGSDEQGGTDLNVTISTVCYAAGTHLATPGGEVAVEALRPGDAVLALEDGAWVARPVRWLGRMAVDLDRHPDAARAAPIRIRADAVAPGVPHRDLLVSPDHALFLGGVLVPAQALVNGATILRAPPHGQVTYLHVELDRHGVLLAEGLPAESFLDTGNRSWFAAEAGVRPLFPDLSDVRTWAADACAPLLLEGPVLAAVRDRLRDRAQALGFRLMRGSGLHLLADGQPVWPETIDGRHHRFRLPASVATVRVVSHAACPADLDPAAADRRRLGVAIAGVAVFTPWQWLSVPLHEIPPGRGLYDTEAAAGRVWRWTSGDAVLALPAEVVARGALLLDLDIEAVQPTWAAPAGGPEPARARV